MTVLGAGLLLLFALMAAVGVLAIVATMFSSVISRREERWRDLTHWTNEE